MRHVIFYFVLLIGLTPITLHSQEVKVTNILATSDSVVKNSISESLFRYFKISVGSYYVMKNKSGTSTAKFLNKNKLKNVESIWVLYTFNYSPIKGVNGGVWIRLDKNLKLIESPIYDFIPDFLIKNQPSNFIDNDTALLIAKKTFQKKGFMVLEPELSYNEKFAKYTYTITNIITKDKNEFGGNAGETEYCVIDAITKEILEHEFGYYGVIIR